MAMVVNRYQRKGVEKCCAHAILARDVKFTLEDFWCETPQGSPKSHAIIVSAETLQD
jgi:hypothetical protein